MQQCEQHISYIMYQTNNYLIHQTN